MNNDYVSKKDLTEELGKFTEIIVERIDSVASRVDRCESGITKLTDKVGRCETGITKLTDIVDRCEAGIAILTDKVDRCEAGIENLTDKFVHAAEYDRTVIEKIEREKAEQESVNSKVNMRLLRLEIGRKPKKRYA